MNGTLIRVSKTSHASLLLMLCALLTIVACGGGSGNNDSGGGEQPPPTGPTPDAFSLLSHDDLEPGQNVSLGSVEVAGIDADASVPASISGGVFSVNNGAQQTSATVRLGDRIEVFAFAGEQYRQSVTVELNIGGVRATGILTTVEPPPTLDVASLVMLEGRFDSEFGSEPWITDGTLAGTRMLKDLTPYGHGNPGRFARLGDAMFLVGDDGVNDVRLWRVDDDGASFLTGFERPDTEDLIFRSVIVSNGQLFVWTSASRSEGAGLWRSDGTDQGAELLIEGYIQQMVALNGVVYARTNDDALWRSDGSAAGTVKLYDIEIDTMHAAAGRLYVLEQGTGRSRSLYWLSPESDDLTFVRSFEMSNAIPYDFSLYSIGDTLYFKGYDDAVGWEIWRSDGTAEGTGVLADLNPGPADGVLDYWSPSFASVDDKLFFLVRRDRRSQDQLYVSDGTAEGTRLVDDLLAQGISIDWAAGIVAAGQSVFFVAGDHAKESGPVHGTELWRTDGTPGGTALVRDINPGSLSSGIREMAAVGEKLYFSADDGTHGMELWVSDGTAAGTRLVADLKQGSGGARPYGLNAIDSRLYFSADDGVHGREAWWLDSSEDNPRLLVDINRTGNANTRLMGYVNLGSKLLFTAITSGGTGSFDWDDAQLFSSDGFAPGTGVLKNINLNGPDRLRNLVDGGDLAYFIADDGTHGVELWRTDGSEQGTELLVDITSGSGSTAFSRMAYELGRLYMGVFDRDEQVSELWVTDGTAAGSIELRNFGSRVSFGPFAAAGDRLFMALDDRTGLEWQLWQTDGTPLGTGPVKVINTNGSSLSSRCSGGFSSASECGLAEFDNQLYFIARNTSEAIGIWKSDGTDAGTVEVLDLQRSSSSSWFPQGRLAATSAGLFYLATTAQAGQELWLFDGVASTNMVADITPGPEGTGITSMQPFNDLLFFTLRTSVCEPLEVPDENGQCTDRFELWRSDGTEAGTFRLFIPPASLSFAKTITMFEQHNGLLYFRYRDNDNYWSYWRTDGTTEGTIGLSTEVMQ